MTALTAGGGLVLHLDASPHWRVAWGEPDWLGPIGFVLTHSGAAYSGGGIPLPTEGVAGTVQGLDHRLTAFDGSDDLGAFHGVVIDWQLLPLHLRASIRAYDDTPILVFRIEAPHGTTGLATGDFAAPSVCWLLQPAVRLSDGAPADTRTYGHQYTEFALPVSGDASCTGFVFAPHRPPVVEPLLFIAPDERTLLLAPLDQFHEQIIAVPGDTEHAGHGVRCGWHGDLAEVPAGFATELAVWAGPSPRQVIEAYGRALQQRSGTQRPTRYADAGVGQLSYWTDNGAVYYYRTAPGCDYETTLERTVSGLRQQDIPVRAVQIDSWFYPHQHLREVSPDGAPLVPPSGMMTWQPRRDLFPNGFRDLQRRCAGLPLIFHSRHFSSHSPYFEQYDAWRDGEYAHPADPALFDLLMEQAAAWGAVTYEQDWLVEAFLGVRGLRQAPGRARAWQEALDRAAGARGLSLQWCMATPADFLQTVTLKHVTSIRTSGDYRYLFDNGLNWVWFLHTNALARALGLNAFKDVFVSHGKTAFSDGEPYAEVESLLATLGCGPVGIGDESGHSDRDLVMRTCREDGALIKPDAPLAAVDRCFRHNSFAEHEPLIGETYSAHPAGRWHYVATFNASRAKKPLTTRVALPDLGAERPVGPVLIYNWRSHTWTGPDSGQHWDLTLAFQDWDYRVVCPLLPGDISVFGDIAKYATVGDRRIAGITSIDGGVRFDVLGAPDALVEVHGYAATRPASVVAWNPGESRVLRNGDISGESWKWEAETGRWIARVTVGAQGHVRVSVLLR